MTLPLENRRRFLHRVAAGGAAGLLASTQPLRADDPTTDLTPLVGAVIGCGGIATHHARHNFAPWFDITAICDVDRQRAELYKQVAPQATTVCDDYQDLLRRDDIDAIFVCTPDHWHTKITVDALRKGKDVYCEKPLTFSVDEGNLIQRTLAETDRILQVGTQQRSDPNFQTAVALARSGRLGAVQRVTAAIGGGPAGGPFPALDAPSHLNWQAWLGQAPDTHYIPERCHGNFRWWYEYSGGKLTDWGAHHVDIALWGLGTAAEGPVEIQLIEAQHPVPFRDGLPMVDHSYNTATSFHIKCVFPSGAELMIRDQAPDLGFDNGVLFECEGGRFFVNRGRLTGKPIEGLSEDPLPEEATAVLRRDRPVMSHMQHFYHACRERTTPISDAASHIRHLNLCHVTNLAMRLNRDLTWDQARGTISDDPEANAWLTRTQRKGFEVS